MAWAKRAGTPDSLVIPICLMAAILAVPRLHAADSGWLEGRSPNFSVITDAGEKRGHEVAFRFEQMEAGFAGVLLQQELTRPHPLPVVAVRGAQDYSAGAPR